MTENEIARIVVNNCFTIHKKYGPGLFESVYEEILCYEFINAGLHVKRQQGIPLVHQDIKLEAGFRADIIIENKVLIEVKSIEAIADIHYKQVQTYLRLTNIKLGILVNFNVVLIKNGLHRIVNNL